MALGIHSRVIAAGALPPLVRLLSSLPCSPNMDGDALEHLFYATMVFQALVFTDEGMMGLAASSGDVIPPLARLLLRIPFGSGTRSASEPGRFGRSGLRTPNQVLMHVAGALTGLATADLPTRQAIGAAPGVIPRLVALSALRGSDSKDLASNAAIALGILSDDCPANRAKILEAGGVLSPVAALLENLGTVDLL